MTGIGKKIIETRKLKGLSQEELAELSTVNLRTIQRIENNENEPRGKTLNLVCEALQINFEDFSSLNKSSKIRINESMIINGFFLFILNIILMCIIGFLALDSDANLNSKIGAYLLSFFIPYFITSKTQTMSGIERMLKFGSGFILYIIISIAIMGNPKSIFTTLVPCLLLSLAVLYYGNVLIKK
jgi:transcriptional regulator with XRE-family HTH domain